MKRWISMALAISVLAGVPWLSGCGGAAENSVAAPPENLPTAEELEAQSQAYADQELELRARDRRK